MIMKKLTLAALLAVFASASRAELPVPATQTVQLAAGGGSVVLTVNGTPGAWYSLLAAPSVNGPWVEATNSPSPFTLTDAIVGKARFYRTIAMFPNFVWCPPGTFLIGSPNNEQDRFADEGPQTVVTLTHGFYLAKYLVTQQDYQALTGTNPAYFQGDLSRPVEQVSWSNAWQYCKTLTTQKQAAGQLPTNLVVRPPTEAEWEYACRAGTTTRFSWGDDTTYSVLGGFGWYFNNSYYTEPPPGTSWHGPWYFTTHAVGQKFPNPWGLYDMNGDVLEWCQDWYGPYQGGSATDPIGPVAGPYRVFRGGNWFTTGAYCRSASRGGGNYPDNFVGGIGFRPVLANQ